MRGQRPAKPRPELDATDPRGFGARALAFLKSGEVKGQSALTLKTRKKSLCVFLVWCRGSSVERPEDVTRQVLERYQRWLFLHRDDDGKPWSTRYRFALLDVVKLFFGWMAKQNHLLFNPASELELPRIEKTLPRQVLTVAEVELVMLQPDLASPGGLRDRAMLETMYSTALRRGELVALNIYDVEMVQGTVMVRQGKGKRDRVVPIGDRALAWVRKYLDDARRYLVKGADCGALFLSGTGTRLSVDVVGNIMRDLVKASGIGKTGSCHIFRHTAATLMLENGANLRFIQAMLGHANLSTTQIYTEVSIKALRDVHAATHPGARLQE